MHRFCFWTDPTTLSFKDKDYTIPFKGMFYTDIFKENMHVDDISLLPILSIMFLLRVSVHSSLIFIIEGVKYLNIVYNSI